MRKVENTVHLEGYLYENNLEMKVTGPNSKSPNTPYITGTITIATDEECTNIVPVHYTYVTPTTSSGKTNPAYNTLANIAEGNYGNVMANGKDKAVKLRIDTSIGLNEFYSDRNGKEELVSVKRNEGGFIHVTDTIASDDLGRNNFKCDILITKTTMVEADEERQTSDKVIVKGYIFDFRNAILPVEFSITNPNGMNYFLSLEASEKNPTFTSIRGTQISETIVRKITEESAFGDDYVREVTSTRKDYMIVTASKTPYAWDEDGSITAKELQEMIAARETYLATIKQRQDEYKASKTVSATASIAVSKDNFNF